MRAFIYTGGAVRAEFITEHPKADDLCIAADSGYNNAKAMGLGDLAKELSGIGKDIDISNIDKYRKGLVQMADALYEAGKAKEAFEYQHKKGVECFKILFDWRSL